MSASIINGNYFSSFQVIEKFCAWCLKYFVWKDGETPIGVVGETVMMAPANGFYTDPAMGRNQVRLAYVLEIKNIKEALFILERALEKYNSEAVPKKKNLDSEVKFFYKKYFR